MQRFWLPQGVVTHFSCADGFSHGNWRTDSEDCSRRSSRHRTVASHDAPALPRLLSPAQGTPRRVDAPRCIGRGFSSTNFHTAHADCSHGRNAHNASASCSDVPRSSPSCCRSDSDSHRIGRGVWVSLAWSFTSILGMKKPPQGLLPLEVVLHSYSLIISRKNQ